MICAAGVENESWALRSLHLFKRVQPLQSVEGCSLAVLRIALGTIAAFSALRIWANGWIDTLYVSPNHLRYPLMAWVPTPDRSGVVLLLFIVVLSSVALACGWHTRGAACFLLISFGWLEFIDVSTYLNHYWFVTMTTALMLVAPVDTCFAVRPTDRAVHPWWIVVFRIHVGAVYAFAGLAKLHSDWIQDAVPLRWWLPARSELPFIGGLLEQRPTAYLLSWAGAIFDLSIVFALCWKRTRLVAWFILIAFHISTWILFPIGVFPWLMIAMSTIFFNPGWPRYISQRALHRFNLPDRAPKQSWQSTLLPSRRKHSVLLAAWIMIVVLLPLRHHVVPGDARWTMEGYRFSWNVLLTERSGSVQFHIVNQARTTTITTDAKELFTPLQWSTMANDPELIRQTAHLLARQRGTKGSSVFVDAFVSLNGRRAVRIIDPTVDLAAEPYRALGQPWILPGPKGPPPG